MTKQSEELRKIRDTIMSLTKLPIDVYYNDPEAHTKIDMISATIWDIQHTNWHDKEAMRDRRVKRYFERTNLEACSSIAEIIGIV